MSITVKEIICANRPPGTPGRTDKYLLDIAQDMRSLLQKSPHLGQPPPHTGLRGNHLLGSKLLDGNGFRLIS
jgi:hypothetical protein